MDDLKGVGPRRAAELARAGLVTVGDLLSRFPLRYEDRGHPRPIRSLTPGETVAVVGSVVRTTLRATRRRGFTIFELLLRDDSGTLPVVWFNQRFLRDVLVRGQVVALFGKVEARGPLGVELHNPQYEIVSRDGEPDGEEHGCAEAAGLHTGRIVPVYERVGSVTAKMQRQLVHEALALLPPTLDDPVPGEIRDRLGLPPRAQAFVDAHFPPADADLALLNTFRSPAHRALVFEELFAFQLGLAVRRRRTLLERKPFAIVIDERVRAAARRVLPFKLTPGQKQAAREIAEDMQRPYPMNRLLQGDVGVGKTIVALLAAVVAMENGLQVALMVPTEILAEQHAATLGRLLAGSRFQHALITGGTPAASRARAALARGEVDLVVGTHALVQEDVAFARLGLVVIDEQHRFGVLQRSVLRRKGYCPDVLVMTATPIPRTLALTLYAQLDVSMIRDRPPGRTPVTTVAKPEDRREDVYALVRREVEAGRQAYVIYPVVEESEKIDVRAATAMADHLAADVFPDLRVGLLHGRLTQEAKDHVVQAFARGDLQILVATTVVEVGVDVPNASVMVIEHAERFGLSQLHQLRGRVGRGQHPSSCVLLYQSPLSDEARERLETMTETADGFVIAERDLALRGPGDLFGTRQAGMPTLRVGNLVRDEDLMALARREADAWMETHPPAPDHADAMERHWAERFGLIDVG